MTAEETKKLLTKIKNQADTAARRLKGLEDGAVYNLKRGEGNEKVSLLISPYVVITVNNTIVKNGKSYRVETRRSLHLSISARYNTNIILPKEACLKDCLRKIKYSIGTNRREGIIDRVVDEQNSKITNNYSGSYFINVTFETMEPKGSDGLYTLKGFWISDHDPTDRHSFAIEWRDPIGEASLNYYNLLKNPDTSRDFLLQDYKDSVQELLDSNKNLKDQKIFDITNAESAEKVIDFVTEQEKVLTKVTTSIEQKVLDPAQLRRTSTTITVLPRSTSSVISNPISQDKIKSDYRKTEELTFDKRLENFQRETYIDRQYSAYSNGLKYDRPCCIRIYESYGRSGYQEPKKLNCFLTQAIQTSLSEKFSLFQSLSGDVLAYFFGKQPVIYRFSVVLYNMYNQQWWHDFRMAFDKTLRGSASIKKNVRTVVSYEDHVLEGFFLEINSNQSTSNPAIVNADFSLLLLQDTIVGDYKERDDINNAKGTELNVIYNSSSENVASNGSIKQADNKKEQIAANNSERMALVPNNTNIIVDESSSIKKDSKNSIEKKVAEEIISDKKTIAFKNNNVIKEFVINFSTKGSSSKTEVKNKKDLKETSDEYKKAAFAVENANRSRK